MTSQSQEIRIIPHLIVADPSAAIDFYVRALGATVDYRLDEPGGYGHRVGTLVDPFGHRWSLHQTKEQRSGSEIAERFTRMMSSP